MTASQLDFFEILGESQAKHPEHYIEICRQTLPPALGGGVRFCARLAGGWWTAYGETEEAAKKSVIRQYETEAGHYGN